jgi:hypothetical protein
VAVAGAVAVGGAVVVAEAVVLTRASVRAVGSDKDNSGNSNGREHFSAIN